MSDLSGEAKREVKFDILNDCKMHRPKRELEFDVLIKKKNQNVTANFKIPLIKTENIKFTGLSKTKN